MHHASKYLQTSKYGTAFQKTCIHKYQVTLEFGPTFTIRISGHQKFEFNHVSILFYSLVFKKNKKIIHVLETNMRILP